MRSADAMGFLETAGILATVKYVVAYIHVNNRRMPAGGLASLKMLVGGS